MNPAELEHIATKHDYGPLRRVSAALAEWVASHNLWLSHFRALRFARRSTNRLIRGQSNGCAQTSYGFEPASRRLARSSAFRIASVFPTMEGLYHVTSHKSSV